MLATFFFLCSYCLLRSLFRLHFSKEDLKNEVHVTIKTKKTTPKSVTTVTSMLLEPGREEGCPRLASVRVTHGPLILCWFLFAPMGPEIFLQTKRTKAKTPASSRAWETFRLSPFIPHYIFFKHQGFIYILYYIVCM